jgi:NAD-dependent SIR2 family protein deacetylase
MGNDGEPHKNKYEEIINLLKTNQLKNITFITGAGISTSAGIPDFRSSNGLFAQTQKKYNLSNPAQFFQISLFYQHPEYFYDFCKNVEKQINSCKPTKAHLFQGFLCKKGLVRRIFTQNVDGLEIKAGCPKELCTFAHGRIDVAGCPECLRDYDIEELKKKIYNDEIAYCEHCKKPIKPKVVFYGEYLPQSYFNSFDDITKTDCAIIMGTSLEVYPFNRLPCNVPSDSWRVLINLVKVSGAFFTTNRLKFDNEYKKDCFIQGYTDEVIQKIVDDCGWTNEFNEYCSNFK